MKNTVRLLFLCLLAGSAPCQVYGPGDRPGAEVPARTSPVAGKSPVELRESARSLRREAERLSMLAKEEDAKLAEAYEHNVGGPKYPSNAEHARTMARVYRERSARCLDRARELEAKADREIVKLQGF